MKNQADKIFRDHFEVIKQCVDAFPDMLTEAVRLSAGRIRRGGRVYLLGNGGSAADAIHWAGELMGRFRLERPGIPALALVDNISVITAVANDYQYDEIFVRQVLTLVGEPDVVVAISTSGNSANVVKALDALAGKGCLRLGFTGQGGGRMAKLVDFLFAVPSRDTPRIQEAHSLLGHAWCELLERELYGAPA